MKGSKRVRPKSTRWAVQSPWKLREGNMYFPQAVWCSWTSQDASAKSTMHDGSGTSLWMTCENDERNLTPILGAAHLVTEERESYRTIRRFEATSNRGKVFAE